MGIVLSGFLAAGCQLAALEKAHADTPLQRLNEANIASAVFFIIIILSKLSVYK